MGNQIHMYLFSAFLAPSPFFCCLRPTTQQQQQATERSTSSFSSKVTASIAKSYLVLLLTENALTSSHRQFAIQLTKKDIHIIIPKKENPFLSPSSFPPHSSSPLILHLPRSLHKTTSNSLSLSFFPFFFLFLSSFLSFLSFPPLTSSHFLSLPLLSNHSSSPISFRHTHARFSEFA